LNIRTAEEITLAEDSLTTISATAPKMSGFGEEAIENFEELEALPFMEDAANMSDEIEVGLTSTPTSRLKERSWSARTLATRRRPGNGLALDPAMTNNADISEIPQDNTWTSLAVSPTSRASTRPPCPGSAGTTFGFEV
jgi:hypothetical protein